MDYKEIGKKIKQLREISGLTQKRLSEILGYSEAHISHLESGNRSLGIEDLKKLANYFGVTYDYFLNQKSNIQFRSQSNGDTNFVDDTLINDFINYARNR